MFILTPPSGRRDAGLPPTAHAAHPSGSIVEGDLPPGALALLNGVPPAGGGEADLLAGALGLLTEVAALGVPDRLAG